MRPIRTLRVNPVKMSDGLRDSPALASFADSPPQGRACDQYWLHLHFAKFRTQG
jgi:hypothetical protein